jgi:hypothetical protein
MAVSKRLRYEVLRRDNHACRYCGARAPEATLTIDHVIPTTLGGDDEPANLVTACRPCNSGKSSSSPDADLVADVSADALRWSRAMHQAADILMAEYQARADLHARFTEHWEEWTFGSTYNKRRPIPLEAGWEKSVDTFLAAGLPMEVLLDCIDTAMAAKHILVDNLFRYMCGIAWRKVGELREIAGALVESDEGP